MDVARAVSAAAERIRGHVLETPVHRSRPLSVLAGARVDLKLENVQYSGSFKLRGAMNKLLSLTDEQRRQGIVAASAGNHGAAVGHGLCTLGGRGVVFVPEGTSPQRVRAIRLYGVDVREHGADCVDTESFARRFAAEHDMVYLSPYNDPEVVAGQGTIAVELLRQLEAFDAVFVAVGGGGLCAGIGGYLETEAPDVEVVACSPASSPVMHESIAAGKIVEVECRPTLSGSTAGGIEPGSITFDICRRVVDSSVLVAEDEIAAALTSFVDEHHMLIEGAAAVAVAGFLKERERFKDARVAIVVCGANISLDRLCAARGVASAGPGPADADHGGRAAGSGGS